MYNSSGWKTETIAANGSNGPGVGTAIAVEPSGKVLAAYLNTGGTDLRVSTRTCSAFPPYTCSWSAGLLVDDYGEENFSLTMDSAGTPHIATLAMVPGDGFRLDYLTRQAGVWRLQSVDTTGSSGWYPSIALSPGSTPRISHQDSMAGDLKLVFKLNTAWLPMVRKK